MKLIKKEERKGLLKNMENKELIIKYIEFKQCCIEQDIFNIDEILGLFKISEELKQ